MGRSFDGFQVAFDTRPLNVTTLLARPTQGGFEMDGGEEINGIDLLAGALTLKNRSALLPEVRLFYISYNDSRDVPKVDNRLDAIRNADRDELQLSTIGTPLLGASPLGPGRTDFLFWGTYQFGEWGKLDHRAFAVAVEGGYQLPRVAWEPWLRAGYFQSSGDADPLDDDHETFFQLIPTLRPYARFPFYNLMNLRDAFLQILLKPIQKLSVRADAHGLWFSEEGDLWYAGSGATRKSGINGFAGRPSGGRNDLAWLLDISLDYAIIKGFTVNVYYAHAFGGEVIQNIFRRADADLTYVEVNFQF